MKAWSRLKEFLRRTDASPVSISAQAPSDVAATRPVDAVRIDLAMPVVERKPNRTVWRNPDGYIVSVDLVSMQWPNPWTPRTAQEWFRQMAEDHKGGLVEAELREWRSGQLIEGIYKYPEGSGFRFTGMMIMPLECASLIWTVVDGEHGTTGVREAVVATEMLKEGELTLEEYAKSWAQDPYDPDYRAQGRVEIGALRYLSDDAFYDSQFPDHPLSRVRAGFRKILADVEIDEEALGGNPV